MREVEDAGELPRWSGEAVPVGGEVAATAAPDRSAAPADGSAEPVRYDEPPEKRRRGLAVGLILGLLGGLLLAGIAGGAYWLGTRQSDDTAATNVEESTLGQTAEGEATTGEDTAGPTAEAEADETATTLEVDTTETTEAGAGESTQDIGAADGQLLLPDGFTPSDPNYDTRIEQTTEYAVVRGGKVYLYGFTPTQELLDESIAVTEGVMGPDGYVVERFVDPDAPEVEGSSIFVDDKVLFAFNSTELQPASLPVLDLGAALMLQNPTARMLIIARSDSVGPADVNLEISQDRGDAVVDYWVSKEVERSRMTVDARGESDAAETDDAQVAALDRSVEFVVSDIDDGG